MTAFQASGILLALSLALSACTPPSSTKVGEQARAVLQKQLEANHPGENLLVQKVDVVAVDRPKYEGTATINDGGSTFPLPVAVTSDGKITLVSVDENKLTTARNTSLRRRLAILDGKYSDYILSPSLFTLLPETLRREPDDFKERLQIIGPVQSDDRWYFGKGCMAHSCSVEEAAWVVSKATGKGYAVVMTSVSGPETNSEIRTSFRAYGTQPENLPPPLLEWATDNGMTLGNSAGDPVDYEPPATR